MAVHTTIAIPNVREGSFFATYERFTVPDLHDIITLTGDYSWSGITVDVKDTPWQTFRENPKLWKLFKSPTACYVEFSDEKDGRITFYRDQQDCILWSVDPATGKVYSDADGLVAETVEEFWCRQYIEASLWFLYAWQHHTGLPPKNKPELRNYVHFYQQQPSVRTTQRK